MQKLLIVQADPSFNRNPHLLGELVLTEDAPELDVDNLEEDVPTLKNAVILGTLNGKDMVDTVDESTEGFVSAGANYVNITYKAMQGDKDSMDFLDVAIFAHVTTEDKDGRRVETMPFGEWRYGKSRSYNVTFFPKHSWFGHPVIFNEELFNQYAGVK